MINKTILFTVYITKLLNILRTKRDGQIYKLNTILVTTMVINYDTFVQKTKSSK